jgi:hypothetical protein
MRFPPVQRLRAPSPRGLPIHRATKIVAVNRARPQVSHTKEAASEMAFDLSRNRIRNANIPSKQFFNFSRSFTMKAPNTTATFLSQFLTGTAIMDRLVVRTLLALAFILGLSQSNVSFGTIYNWTGTGNWNTTGPWGGAVPTTGDTGNIATGTATANATLAGSPIINVTGTGTLFINALGVPLTSSGTVNVSSGGRINYQGTSASASTILLGNGATVGRPQNNVLAISNNPLSLAAGATVTAGNVTATVTWSTLGLQLSGPLSSADSAATFVVNPTTAGQLGSVILAPTTANTGFIGNASVQAGPGGATPGTLVLSGTGALSNVNTVTIGSGAQLRFRTATDPFAASKAISVPTGARVEWEGVPTFTMAQALRPTITFQNGAIFGRSDDSNIFSRSLDNIVIGSAAGATVTAARINTTVTRTSLGLELAGTLSSFDNSATLVVNPSAAGYLGPLVIKPTTSNTGYTGNVSILAGPGGATPGVLVLSGTGALSNVNNFSIGSGAILRFADATNPLPSSYALNVPTGARVEWEGSVSAFTGGVLAPTITLQNGSTIGHEENQNVLGISNANIVIAAGATATASRINATVTRSTLGMQLSGPLSSGDSASTLVVNPTTAGFVGSLVIAPTTNNTGFTGNVSVQAGPGGATPGTLVLSGTGALSNVNNLTVNSGAILRFRNATNPLPSAYAMNIPSGGRLEWEGTTSAFTGGVIAPTFTMQNGSTLGREEDNNALGVLNSTLFIPSSATTSVTRILSSVTRSGLGLQLAGPLTSADSTSKLLINPTTAGYLGSFTLAPTAANTGFTGDVEIQAGPGGATPGTLVLSGTGALSNVDAVTIGSGATLRFRNATNPLPAGYALNVPTGGRVEWEGQLASYSVTKPTITFQNGSFFGREEDQDQLGIGLENIAIASGATVTATRISASVVRTDLGLRLNGSISGDATTKIRVNAVPAALNLGPLVLNSSTANPFAGTVELNGVSAANQGTLVLQGTGPLANAKLLDINNFTTAMVFAPGAANGIDEIRVHNGGTLRFRDNVSSTLNNSSLTGDGLVRSELVDSATTSLILVNQALRPLTLTNTVIAPGYSAGTLSFQTTNLTIGTGSTYEAELGLTSDVVAVTGNLTLGSGSILELSNLAGFTPGTHVIATYSGSLTGTFSSIVNNISALYALNGINYGTGFNSFISIETGFAPAPEPTSGLLAGLGLIGMMAVRRKQRAQK